jgi:DNA-directed RNA polymerase subunit N (RpoN/RPB10)
MLYSKCPTCNKLFADIVLVYEDEMKKICNNPKLTSKQKDEAKEKLINSLGLDRYCCRMRIISYIDMAELMI